MELVPLSDAALAQAVAWHRAVAAMVEAADRAGVAAEDLPELRARLATQSGLLSQAASRLGAPLPALVPSAAEVASAGANLGDLSPAAVASATRTMRTTLAAVDSALNPEAGRTVPPAQATPSTVDAPRLSDTLRTPGAPAKVGAPRASDTPGTQGGDDAWRVRPGGAAAAVASAAQRSVRLRNAAIYGAYSAAVLAVQVVLFLLLDESTSLPTAAPLCLLILPAFAWTAGWLSIGVLFTPGPDGTLDRSPRLGVLVCMIPNVLLCAAVGVLFVAQVT